MANIEEKVENLITPIINKIGYDVYDVEFAKEGKNFFLRVFIDKEEGINIQDCEKVNDAINDKLDEANFIKQAYFLEVSSPGIERVLRKDRHLSQNIGKEVEVKLFQKDKNGKKEIQGTLIEFNEKEIKLKILEEVVIDRKNIAQIKTIYNW